MKINFFLLLALTTSICLRATDTIMPIDHQNLAVDDTKTELYNKDQNGILYISTDHNVKMIYNFEKKQIHLKVQSPLMVKTMDERTICSTVCYLKDKEKLLIFDIVNKVEGVAFLRGFFAYTCNISLHKYFKKHMPNTFDIEIPYEMERVKYTMKIASDE